MAYRRRETALGRWLLAGLVVILLFLFLFKSPLEKQFLSDQSKQKTTEQVTTAQLVNQMKKLTDDQNGTYAIYVYDLTSKNSFGINEKTVVIAASVAKIPIVAALYSLADQDKVDLDEMITIQPEDLQEGTGVVQLGQTYSVKTLARLMMEKSDNTAAHVLAVHIGIDTVQELVNKWGLEQTSMAENKTSPHDMVLLLAKMYRGEVAKKALTGEMLGFMNDSDFEDRLPALLPKEVKIYHKIGTETNALHDVGIVDLPDRPYIIGIFTHGISDEQKTVSTIARLSRLVFDYQKSLY